VEQAETDELTAGAVNAEAPAVMAEEAKRIVEVPVHYLTDYIFDGRKGSQYDESDPSNPINVYGKTKLEGERGIQDVGPLHLIFRTSWVYATRGRNFLLRILRLATEREELQIVEDQIGAPTSSRKVAGATARILKKLTEQARGPSSFAGVSGIYHMTAAGETSWFEFAKAILQEASCTAGCCMVCCGHWRASFGCPSRHPSCGCGIPDHGSPAPYSVLSNSHLVETFGFQLPDWRVQLHLAFTDTDS
jgi:dTDP-4-dehydrorhamnose reductase